MNVVIAEANMMDFLFLAMRQYDSYCKGELNVHMHYLRNGKKENGNVADEIHKLWK